MNISEKKRSVSTIIAGKFETFKKLKEGQPLNQVLEIEVIRYRNDLKYFIESMGFKPEDYALTFDTSTHEEVRQGAPIIISKFEWVK